MKNRVYTFAFFLAFGLVFTACQGDKTGDTNAADSQAVAPAITPPPAANAGGVNAGVEHYICPSGHVGSGGPSQGTCSNCGVALVHNQAYHSNDPVATPAAPAAGANPMLQNPGATPPTVAAPPASAPQNAAGVWHYTCPSGCAGGAGAAGSCSNCGTALAHNQAYHN